jgi:hypothetical protein
MRVDTKSAGFVVVDVPLQRTVTVAGEVALLDGEKQVRATGIRY